MARGWAGLGLGVLAFVSAAAMARAALAPIDGGAGSTPPAPWQLSLLPQQKEPVTRFVWVDVDGRAALRVQADRSYGNLVHALSPDTPVRTLSWRWRVDEPNARADLRTRDGDDAAIKVCVMFDLPLAAVPFAERQLLRFARTRSDDPLPAATVCYVWDRLLPAGTVLDNAYSRRVRWLVLRGPEAPLQRWQAEQRDLQADFLRLFGDETREVPPVIGIGVAGDADNTGARSLAYLAGLLVEP